MVKNKLDIKLPSNKEALRIKHLPAIMDNRLLEKYPSVEFKIDTIKVFTGISKPRLFTVDLEDIHKMFDHLLNIISKMDMNSELPKEITVGEKEFILVDPEKAPGGWHADYANSDFKKDPVRLACMCYIPKGSFYGQLDQHDNLVNPIHSRHELFEKEFPLEIYIRMSAFFLRKWNRLTLEYTAKQKRIQQTKKLLDRISGFGKNFSTLFRKNTT